MSNLNLADQAYVKEQYRASDNLQARITLHERFSIAKQKWFDWYWEHLDLPATARILEIGCGTGMLWRENRARIPATWQITLSDFSFGMIETTRAANVVADYLQSDAQAIPFRDHYFDAVIANHMLYHVPNVARTLTEIRRVLKPTGKFYAATNGETHLLELKNIISEILDADSNLLNNPQLAKQFSLENGTQQLASFFACVERFDHLDALVVTQVEPLVAFSMSGFMGKPSLDAERERALHDYFDKRIACDGAFRITKSTGLFIATS